MILSDYLKSIDRFSIIHWEMTILNTSIWGRPSIIVWLQYTHLVISFFSVLTAISCTNAFGAQAINTRMYIASVTFHANSGLCHRL